MKPSTAGFLLAIALWSGLAQPLGAQTNVPAALPPAAQEALGKGIIAAKVPDYPLAIRYFEEARKLAPAAAARVRSAPAQRTAARGSKRPAR